MVSELKCSNCSSWRWSPRKFAQQCPSAIHLTAASPFFPFRKNGSHRKSETCNTFADQGSEHNQDTNNTYIYNKNRCFRPVDDSCTFAFILLNRCDNLFFSPFVRTPCSKHLVVHIVCKAQCPHNSPKQIQMYPMLSAPGLSSILMERTNVKSITTIPICIKI